MKKIFNLIEVHEDHIRIKEATKKGYAVAVEGDSVNLEQPSSRTRRGRVGKGVANTINCGSHQSVVLKGDRAAEAEKTWINELEKFNFNMEENKLLSLFSGIGAFEESLRRLGVPVQIKNFAEIDIDAIISYASIHIPNFEEIPFDYPSEQEMREWLIQRNIGWDYEKGKSKIPRLKKDKLYKVYKASIIGNNLGDVSLIDYENFGEIDIIVGGSPCQDFSVAGKRKGSIWNCKECGHEYNPIEQYPTKREYCPNCNSSELDKTRSSLLVEYLRSIRILKPKFFVYENVKNIKGKGFIDIFNLFEKELADYGYKTYNKVINAKNNGIPQNRERVFVVGIRENINLDFKFSEDFDNGVRLKDVLENEVDEKYFISNEKAEKIIGQYNGELAISHPIRSREFECQGWKEDCPTLCARDYKDPKNLIMPCITPDIVEKRQNGRRFKEDGEPMFTITSQDRHGILTNSETNKVQRLGNIYDTETKKQNCQAGRIYDKNGISPALNTMQGGNRQPFTATKYKIRKLTPLECWRLMGFEDESFYKAKALDVSNSSLYKQAGNSIVVNCLYYIFKEIFKNHIC